MIGAIVFPAACLVIGLAFGILVTRYAFFLGYREHVDKHFFSVDPARDCVFCVEERGSAQVKAGEI